MPLPGADRQSLRITVLGTGTSQGIPVIGCKCAVCTSSDPRDRRFRTSVMIHYQGTALLIDAGPDLRQQMLANDLDNIDAILLTHEHNDHISGLDDVRPVNFRHRKSITVYGLPRVLKAVHSRFDYVFDAASDYPGLPRLTTAEIFPGSLSILDVPVEVIEVFHGPLPVLGFRIGDFSYITDAKTIHSDQLKRLENSRVLFVNALHRKPHWSHFHLEEALEFIEALSPGQAYLTHLSHDMGTHADVEALLPENVFIAYDGLCIDIL